MQVQHVELARGHTVNGASQGSHAEEMPRYVDKQTPPGKPRLVEDLAARQGAVIRYQLPQGAEPVENAPFGLRP